MEIRLTVGELNLLSVFILKRMNDQGDMTNRCVYRIRVSRNTDLVIGS